MNLVKHIASRHKGVNYACNKCDHKATRRENLLKHVESIHEGVKFSCEKCDYKATRKGHLLRHIKSIHQSSMCPKIGPYSRRH